MRKVSVVLIVATVVVLLVTAVHAQTAFPNKPVTIVVPYAAGGPTDLVTRVLADELSRVWNQRVVVENKPGGGTIVGVSATAHARPDGYTMLTIAPAFVINPAVRKNLPYNVKEFAGISIFAEGPQAIVAHPGFAPNTLVELVGEAKKRSANPLSASVGTLAGASHMTGELLQSKLGIKLKIVPYAGSAQSLPDVLAGRVDFEIATWGHARPHVQAGKMKLISMLFRKRLPDVPNTPTVFEELPAMSGLPMGAFLGIAVPAGVPKEIIAQISSGMRAADASKSYQERMQGLNHYTSFTTPEETDAFLAKSVATWTEIANQAGINLK